MYHTILFDLDGTLTDSSEGIYRCINDTMKKMGLPPVPRSMISRFIGPPLEDSFRDICGLSPEDSITALNWFEAQYTIHGEREVRAIPGMTQALETLKAHGLTLAVASSKEEPDCYHVLENLGLQKYFQLIAGHNITSAPTKAAVIQHALTRLGLPSTEGVLMVGDRHYDVEGAAACGIPCLGVDYCGFAAPGELEAAGAIAVVHTPPQMAEFILRG